MLRLACACLALAFAGCRSASTSTSEATRKLVIAELDPGAAPPVLPTPNDLARDPSTGLLLAPDRRGASAAEVELNAWLRTLDGFPPATVATATFTGPIDPASVKPSNAQLDGSVAVFDRTTQQPLTKDDFDLVVADDRRSISIVPHLPRGGRPAGDPWRLGHTYLVILFGGPGGLRAAEGQILIRAQYFSPDPMNHAWVRGMPGKFDALPPGRRQESFPMHSRGWEVQLDKLARHAAA